MDILDLFPDRVSPEPNSGCWLWTGGLKDGKYGAAYYEREQLYAHRLSSALSHGPLKPREMVLHHCDTFLCVNPDHLFRGDQWSNMRDMGSKGRSRSRLSVDTVLAMRKMYEAEGVTVTAVAQHFGVPGQTAYQIVKRKRWSYV